MDYVSRAMDFTCETRNDCWPVTVYRISLKRVFYTKIVGTALQMGDDKC